MAEWASQFEGEHGATELVGLAIDSRGDVALAGHVYEDGGNIMDGRKDAIVMKLASSDGTPMWRRSIGVPGSHDWSSAVSADSTGNIFVAGQTNGLLFAAEAGTGQDIWVTKLDGSNGELLWGYQVGTLGQDTAATLAVDSSSGDVVVCGSTTGGLYEDPVLYMESADDGAKEDVASGKNSEPFCAKLATADGSVVWGSRLRGIGNQGILAAAVDPLTGDVFAAGFTGDESGMGASNYLAVRIGGHDGAERWRSTGGGGWTGTSYAGVYVEDSACAIAVDNGGGVVIAGNTEGALFESTVAGQDTDAFVAKLNATDGTGLWGWQAGSSGNDYANGVAVDSHGDVYACGAASGRLFDDGNEPSGEGALPEEDSLIYSSTVWGALGDAAREGEGRRGEGGIKPASYVTDVVVAKLDGNSGKVIWGAQFGSGAGDQAVGLVLGPETRAGAEPRAPGGEEGAGGTDGSSPLYLTGWTRGALYSSVPARWQDGWAVKLSNPPPVTFGFFHGAAGGGVDGRRPVTVAGSDSAQAKHSASDAALGAVTAGLVGTVVAMVVIVLAALCFVLRRASHGGGALSAARYDPVKGLLRRRNRTAGHDGGGAKVTAGSGKVPDGVELKLLSEGGDAGHMSPRSTRQGSSGGGAVGGRRDTSPQDSLQQPNFYL